MTNPTLLLKNLLFTLLIPGTAAIYAPYWLTRELPPPGGLASCFSAPFFGLGLGIYGWCLWDFATFGGGTPLPIDAPRRLVVRGLYHYTRNPMYVGVLTTVVAWVVLYRALSIAVYACLLWSCFQSFIVFYEEPHLSRVFGREYADYRSRVGRWLPRF